MDVVISDETTSGDETARMAREFEIVLCRGRRCPP
jgi:hypothetical protein